MEYTWMSERHRNRKKALEPLTKFFLDLLPIYVGSSDADYCVKWRALSGYKYAGTRVTTLDKMSTHRIIFDMSSSLRNEFVSSLEYSLVHRQNVRVGCLLTSLVYYDGIPIN